MKRTPIAGTASALFLAAALALGGCGGDPASISSPSSQPSSSQPSFDSSVSSTAAPSSATTSADPTSRPDVEPFVIPDPVTGTYNGKTITMQYAAVTDYIYPGDNLRPTYFSNGYAGFHYYGKIGEEEHYVGGTFMDKTGKMICEPIYSNVAPFNSDGIALVIKQKKSGWPGGDGPWLYLDSTGTEKGECTEDPDIWLINDIEKSNTELTNGSKRIGRYYNGLAPFIQDQKLGFVDENKEVVIPASYPVITSEFTPLYVFNEDLLIVNAQGRIAIIEIIRS